MKTIPSIPLWQRDLLLIIFSLAVLVVLSWAYLIDMAHDMPKISMQGMAESARIHPWAPLDFQLMFLMWAIMMVGMMVPTAMRTVLIYARIAKKAEEQKQVVAPSYLFMSGYVVIWTFFSLAATIVQWGLDQATLLSPMMVASSRYLGASLLICAGLYQMTPLKDVCLKHCQSPAMFIASHYKKGSWGAFELGLRHGTYCLGCCWVLMGLLFLGGVMNLLWIAAITLFVLMEKLFPPRLQTARPSGLLMIAAGVVYLFIPNPQIL